MQREPEVPLFPEHFDGKRFVNPDARQAPGLLDALRWKFTSRPEPNPRFVSDVEPSKPPASVDGDDVRITFVNHSTVLLQQVGLHTLTDPIWSRRASPFSWVGPHRRREPGVRWQDLPRIDLVLISHNHYDHLDLPTLRHLMDRGRSQFIVPSGVGQWMRARNIGPAHELNWGESFSLAGATIHSVPALHFSARGLFDRNRTLWCGYVMEAMDRIIYFAGDTGFGDHFATTRDRFGSPTLALLPIGAYEPPWFMSPVHMGPDEAMRAHHILGAKTSIAIHHGTFQLGDDAIDTPGKMLRDSLMDDSFLVLHNGQSVAIPR